MYFSILVVAMLISFASGNPADKQVDEGSVFNFGEMSSCATNSYSSRYDGYGCFCGLGGHGTPVDNLDVCCQVHDNCYGDVEAANGEPCPQGTNIYTLEYTYECRAPWSWFYKAEELTITCDAEANDGCAQALCECDKTASLCFAANEYNDEYASYDKENMCTA
ncbi:neutral phospholipase A2 3 [Strongylocentrotus purpuratus]|uniref:Phospholipase A2 n=1 Tax=Strongylocentrotus purpuratus TaxID=7668 RepID=A0A7M7N9K3_STRPU|nr:neutral phospholipase A2 3 [Strongylocentrotus purpuratus]|eukprot:XP_001188441.2 PREDICTED: neutral phospholipase A2 3 [Strongylocentrotus purpuratus]